jgi:hypothetical protein
LKMTLRLAMLLSVFVTAVSCIDLPPPAPPATPAQSGWFAQRNMQSLVFRVPDADSTEVWVRAKLWIANYADFKLQTVDDVLLETYYPPGEAAARFGYQVTRHKVQGGEWEVSVRAVTGNPYAGNSATAMGQSLAFYIRTGQDCPGCGGGRLGFPNRL